MGRVNFNDIVILFSNEKEKKGKKKVNDEKGFYDQQVKYFSDILKTLNIWGERKYMKKEFDDLKEYSFHEADVDFIKQLLYDYTGKEFKSMRKNNFHKVSHIFLEKIIYGFKNVLVHNEAPEYVIKGAVMKMYDRTNYPLNRQIEFFKQPLEKLAELAEDMFYYKSVEYLTRQDRLAWLLAMQNEMDELIKKWKDIYQRIDEIRNDEINDIAFEEASNMTDEEEADAVLEMNVTMEVFSLLKNNKEYQELCDEKEKLIQDDGFVQKKVKRFDEITERIFEIYNETQKELYDSNILIDFRNERDTCNFNAMKSSKEVIAIAIKEREDDIKFREEWGSEVLKEFDIEKMINNIKNKSSLENTK